MFQNWLPIKVLSDRKNLRSVVGDTVRPVLRRDSIVKQTIVATDNKLAGLRYL